MKKLFSRWAPPRWQRVAAFWFVSSIAFAENIDAAVDPWNQAVNVLKTAFTGPIATGMALVAIVLGWLMFAFGEGGAKRGLAGVIFGTGMAVGAANFLTWLFG